MRITCYGGVGEIGGNKVLLSTANANLFLDFGMSFKKRGDYYEDFLQPRTNNVLRDLLRLGVIPAIDGIYRDDLVQLRDLPEEVPEGVIGLMKSGVKSYQQVVDYLGRPTIDGILVSHGHVDHYQDLALLDHRIPVYSGKVTQQLIRIADEIGRGGISQELVSVKLRFIGELGRTAFFPGAVTLRSEAAERRLEVFSDAIELPGARITLLPVDHSVPGASAFYIETDDGKTILYTGDIRFHGRRADYNEWLFAFVESHPVDVMLVEGTRIDRQDADSEELVEQECQQVVSQAQGLVLVAFAWKDTTRFETLRRVAKATGRQLVISPKLAYLLDKLADDPAVDLPNALNDPAVKVYLKRKDSLLYSRADYVASKYDLGLSANWDKSDPASIRADHYDNGIRAYDIRSHPKQFILHMDYFDLSELIDLEPPKGSILIRAVSEPFNEEMALEEARLIRWLEKFGINEHTAPAHRPIYVHASGHASGPEIRDFIKRVKPKTVIPLHTEKPKLFVKLLEGTSLEIKEPQYGKALEFS